MVLYHYIELYNGFIEDGGAALQIKHLALLCTQPDFVLAMLLLDLLDKSFQGFITFSFVLALISEFALSEIKQGKKRTDLM